MDICPEHLDRCVICLSRHLVVIMCSHKFRKSLVDAWQLNIMEAEQISAIRWVKYSLPLKLLEFWLEHSHYTCSFTDSIVSLDSLVVYGTSNNQWTDIVSPECCHVPPNTNIFSPMICADTNWSSILWHSRLKLQQNCHSFIIICATTKCYWTTKTINSIVYHKAPSNHLWLPSMGQR